MKAAEAKINAKKALERQQVSDCLREMKKPQNQPENRPNGVTPAEARKAAWSAVKSRTPSTPRSQDQKAADVGEQPLSGTVGLHGKNIPVDVTQVQASLVAQGMLDPKYATGFPGTAMLDAIKALQTKNGQPANGTINPGGALRYAPLFGPINTLGFTNPENPSYSLGLPLSLGIAGGTLSALGGPAALRSVTPVTKHIIKQSGREYWIGDKVRVAPLGNRWRHRYGKWPHYHRAIPDPKNLGHSIEGQGMGRHRPWQPYKKDKSLLDRF